MLKGRALRARLLENVVKDVSLRQSGCEVNEDGLVMIDSGASVSSVPSGSENRFFKNQTDQFNSEVRKNIPR